MPSSRLGLSPPLLAALLALAWWSIHAHAAVPVGPTAAPGWPRILGSAIDGHPAVADVDGDGRDEVAVGARDGQVFLLGHDGSPWPGWPVTAASSVFLGPTWHDLDGDGRPELLAADHGGLLHAWSTDGSSRPGWPVDLHAIPVSRPAVLSREDGDLILVLTRDGRLHAVTATGAAAPGWPATVGARQSLALDLEALLVHDLDGDGRDEVVALGERPAMLHVLSADGRPRAGFPRRLGEHGIGLAALRSAGRSVLACTLEHAVLLLSADGSTIWREAVGEAEEHSAAPAFVHLPGLGPSVVTVTSGGTIALRNLAGRLQPGWPRAIGGFIYGLASHEERFSILAPPVVCDVDGDAAPELVFGSYDQHVYAMEADGSPVPGWPVIVDDSVRARIAVAQIDGRGAAELVVPQGGETLFVLQVDAAARHRTARPPITLQHRRGHHLLLAGLLVGTLVVGIVWSLARLPREIVRSHRLALGVLVAGALALAGLIVLTGWNHARSERRLAGQAAAVATTVIDMRVDLQARTDQLARELVRDAAADRTPARLLYHLERLADRARLDDTSDGVAVVTDEGDVVAAVGLARGWRLARNVGHARPVILGDDVALVAASGLAGHLDGHRLLRLRSVLASLPYRLSRDTGASVRIVRDGRILAWAGPPPAGTRHTWPWLGVPEPTAVTPLPGTPLSVHLSDESRAAAVPGWLTLALVLMLPGAAVHWLVRRAPSWSPRGGPLFLAGAVAAYLGAWALLAGGSLVQRPVDLGTHLLEIVLHLAGLGAASTGVLALVGGDRARRLSMALLGSYLVVSLLPLAAVGVIGLALLQQAQRELAIDTVRSLERRADHLALAYMGSLRFRSGLEQTARRLGDQPPDRVWYNFVAEHQQLFTYDLPPAYLTFTTVSRDHPGRSFTGFTWRAPRTEKFPTPLPAWAAGDPPRGLFMDGDRPVVRAARTLRSPDFTTRFTSHIPLDQTVLDPLAERLRILPFLPRVTLEPAWRATSDPSSGGAGWRLPLVTRLALPARDWRTGAERWVVYHAHAFLPAGRELGSVVAALLLLTLLPLGLSMWGAYLTWKRTVLPLGRLLEGIRRVESGDIDVRLGGGAWSEIGQASRAFDGMTASLRRTIQLEAERRKAEELSDLKSHFLSMVSHDLKTPLAAIRGATENLLAGLAGSLNAKQRQYLTMVLESSDNLQQMVADILDLTRIESGSLQLTPETLDLAREADQVLRSMAPLLEVRALRPELDVRCRSPRLRADRTRLWQMLTNVVGNAVRHSPHGGRVRIAIDDAELNGAPALEVRIDDDGPGIPAADRARVFEAYMSRPRADRPGAGLGLAIVKQLVELHGGSVALTAASSGGTRVVLTLPAPDERSDRAGSAHPPAITDGDEPTENDEITA